MANMQGSQEPSDQIRPIQFIAVGNQSQVPAPFIRVTTCGLLTIEIIAEMVSADPPRARYVSLTPEQLRGRGTTPALTLLKLLLNRYEHFASKDWLLEQFCRDGEQFASARIENIVSLLRGLICPPAYQDLRTHLVAHVRSSISSGDGYQLALYPLIWVDSEALAWNVEQAARMERFGDDGLPFWERAYELAKRGPYLPDEMYSEWATFRREEVRGMLRQSVQALARLYVARHGAAGEEEALLLLRSFWQEHLHEEDVLRPLMELLGRLDRYQEALEYYQKLCHLLEEEQLQPDSQTRDIATYMQNKQLQRQNKVYKVNNHIHLQSEVWIGNGNEPPMHTSRYIPFYNRKEYFSSLKMPQYATDNSIPQMLISYLQKQKQQMLQSFVPGSLQFTMEDILCANGLFIPLSWDMAQRNDDTLTLAEILIARLMQRERLLLLGEAGQGKTTIMKYIFTLLVDRFEVNPFETSPLPLYVPLRDISLAHEDAIELLWTYLKDDFPLPLEGLRELFQHNQIVCLFDGFDEVTGNLTQRAINERIAHKLFTLPSILSCRKNFYDSYLSLSPIQEYLSRQVEICPLLIDERVVNYITIFCEKKQEKTQKPLTMDSQAIIQTLLHNHILLDLAQRPLLLIMLLDILTDQPKIDKTTWNTTRLYQYFTEKWLKREATKPDSLLKWVEKSQLMQDLAWSMYIDGSGSGKLAERHQRIACTQRELLPFIEQHMKPYSHFSPTEILEDICFRTFLITHHGDMHSFIHKSFQEYYIAQHIFDNLRKREINTQQVTSVLQEVLPVDIAAFLKEMLRATDEFPREQIRIVEKLIHAYKDTQGEDLLSITVRQHVSAYLAFLGTSQVVQFLEQTYKRETNKWVQRAMMVGLALFCHRYDILKEYIEILLVDEEAASINLGYHLVYYGDQAPEDGYYDCGGAKCEGTVQSIFRRLNKITYQHGWALDLLTLRMLIERRGLEVFPANGQYYSQLQVFLNQHQHGSDTLLQRECLALQILLQRTNST